MSSVDPVQSLDTWVPVAEDVLVDLGYHIPGYAERKAAELAEMNRAWRALPRHERFRRRASAFRWRLTDRFREWLHARLFPECDR